MPPFVGISGKSNHTHVRKELVTNKTSSSYKEYLQYPSKFLLSFLLKCPVICTSFQCRASEPTEAPSRRHSSRPPPP
ncbi:Os03g0665751, partial [Oryza sativa Japonica Group]